MIRLRLTPDTVGTVARGHPWVYADGVHQRAPVGEPVQLVDPQGKPVAFGLAEHGDIAVRVLARHPVPLSDLIAARLTTAARCRPGVLPPDTDAYRVVNGAGDGLPGVVVDRYSSVAVLRLYGRCWTPHVPLLVRALQLALPECPTVFQRFGVRAVDGRTGGEVLAGPDVPDGLIVREAGLRFLVRPRTGQKTGLFLDQREHRRFVAGLARDQQVVNLFAYTGGFSVHAAAAGAVRVHTVDIAAPALDDARENFRLNGLDPTRHVFECADAFAWPVPAGTGVLVCDPPSLSHDSSSDHAARRAYRDLNGHCGRALGPNALLATASCTARLSSERWEQAVREGLRKAGRWSWLWRAAEPPDHPVAVAHPEGRYLKFAVLRRHG